MYPLKNINQTALLKSGQTELFTPFLAKSQCPAHFQKKIQRIDKQTLTYLINEQPRLLIFEF